MKQDKALVIVALPDQSDSVRKVSSEKEPHLTLLYLGQPEFDGDQMGMVLEYIEHAASQLQSFVADVDSRGELGEKKADVLFFDKKMTQRIEDFRSHLLKNELIERAYLSAEQFPGWVPHLTLGYPDNPAKKADFGYGSFSFVNFDRIALWTGDYSGPTYNLKRSGSEVAMEHAERKHRVADDVLKHYGVKGMRWGVTRTDAQLAKSAAKKEVSDDFKSVASNQAKIKVSGTKSLSNKELQAVITRANLEKQYRELGSQDKGVLQRGDARMKRALALGKTYNEVQTFLSTPAGKAAKNVVKMAATVAAGYATGGAGPAAAAGAGLAVRTVNNHYTNVGN